MWEIAVELTIDQRWDLVDRIAKETIEVGAYEPTLRDTLADVTVKPLTGIPFAIAVIYGFWMFFSGFAGFFTDGFFVKIFDVHFLPWIQSVFPGKGTWLYFIFVGDPSAETCFESFGVLTSGLFLPIGVVLPAIVAFYLVFAFLEDVGYLPRLAVLVDGVLHKIGLHGYAIIPTILSLGCNVPGVTACRPLESRKQRFMMITLLGVFIPCAAQIGMMEGLIPHLIGWVFLTLAIGYFAVGFILNKVWPGESPEILMDVPPYQKPTWRNIGRKMGTRTSHFLMEAVPFFLLGCLIVAVMYLTGAMDWLGNALAPALTGVFGVPEETVAPLVAGFLRKDLAIGLLGGIELTTWQMFTSVVLLCIYFPCLATFALMLKEEKWKEFLATMLVLVVTVFVFGGLLNLIGIGLGIA
ncbi:MAG TPA: ferrous iron transporter B [Dehalococcoidia bacterium]|nr:ferrous iron transporter B [Dehalococcoidia bacterium]